MKERIATHLTANCVEKINTLPECCIHGLKSVLKHENFSCDRCTLIRQEAAIRSLLHPPVDLSRLPEVKMHQKPPKMRNGSSGIRLNPMPGEVLKQSSNRRRFGAIFAPLQFIAP